MSEAVQEQGDAETRAAEARLAGHVARAALWVDGLELALRHPCSVEDGDLEAAADACERLLAGIEAYRAAARVGAPPPAEGDGAGPGPVGWFVRGWSGAAGRLDVGAAGGSNAAGSGGAGDSV